MVSPDESIRMFHLSSVHTHELGMAVGEAAKPGLIIALQGDLGAGKTTFTQGLAEAMGIDDRVTSPTFTLVNEYGRAAATRLIHVDTYRLGDLPDEVLLQSTTFGLEEILDPEMLTDPEQGAVVVIEWAERIESALPADRLHIRIRPSGDDSLRDIDMTAGGPISGAVLGAIQHSYVV